MNASAIVEAFDIYWNTVAPARVLQFVWRNLRGMKLFDQAATSTV
jgi:hypothetical protein